MKEEEKNIVSWLDSSECKWSNELSRRTQQYGYLYSYCYKNISDIIQPLSGPIEEIADRLLKESIFNEYTQKQGISPHIDSKSFGPIIASISMIFPYNMIFHNINDTNDDRVILLLEECSLLRIEGEARYLWKHGILSTVNYTDKKDNKTKKSENYRTITN
jgi:alkylated DNA repair dioxygenase AlkB